MHKNRAASFVLFGLIAGGGFLLGGFLFRGYLSGFFVSLRGGFLGLMITGSFLIILMSLMRSIREKDAILLYVLAAFGSIPYQTALLFDGTLRASLVRCLIQIVLLAGMILFLISRKIPKRPFVYFVIWLFLGCSSLLGPYAPDNVMMLYAVGLVFPGLFFLMIHLYETKGGGLERLSFAFACGTVLVLSGMILIMVVATKVKTFNIVFSRNASDLNFGSGLLILGWPFLMWKWEEIKLPLRIFILALVSAAALLSFSRGAILCILFLLAVTFIKRVHIRKFLLPFSLILATVLFVLPSSIPEYWLEKLNIGQGAGILGKEMPTFSQLALSSRPEIWDLAIESFKKSPLLGNGLGSFAKLSHDATGGEIENVDAHSMILTIAAERGIVGLIPAVFILSYLLLTLARRWRLEKGPRKEYFRLSLFSLIIFLFFAHTTGAEFLRAGTVWVDSLISVYLAGYLGIAVAAKRTSRGGLAATGTKKEVFL